MVQSLMVQSLVVAPSSGSYVGYVVQSRENSWRIVLPTSSTAPMIAAPNTAPTVSTIATTYYNWAGTWTETSTWTDNYRILTNEGQVWVTGTSVALSASLLRHSAMIRAREDKKARSAIKKALKLIANVGFEEEARIFLKGDTVEVSHPDSLLKFVIKKGFHSVIGRTKSPGISTPYSLSLYTKSDVHVANLCVYMRDTPMLDQVLALAMFIKSGSEEMILRQANWSRLTQDQELREILKLEHPYLIDKL